MTKLELHVLLFAASVVVSSIGFAPPGANAAEHTLMPSPQTVHVGYFSAALKPVLTVNSGDIVTIESVGGPDPADIEASGLVSPSAIPDYVHTIRRDVTDRGPGPHILTGPVFVNGAMPGDVLEVRILEIEPAVPYGFNRQRPYAGGAAGRTDRNVSARYPDRSLSEDRHGGAGRGCRFGHSSA